MDLGRFGKIFILVSCEARDDKIVEVYREFSVDDACMRKYEKENGYTAQNIYTLVSTSIANIRPVLNGNIGRLLDNLLVIKKLYTEIPKIFNLFHKSLPRLMAKVYERIYVIQDEIEKYIETYSHLNEIVEVLCEVDNLLNDTKKLFDTFWKEKPETFIRLPINVTRHCLSSKVFLEERYLPYTMGNNLAEWMDPQIVMAINEARKIYHTRMKTIEMRRNILIPLSLKNLPTDIIKIIATYTQVDVIFDLLPIVLPFELLNKDVRKYSYDNVSCIYTF